MSDSQRIIDAIIGGNKELKEEFQRIFAVHEAKEIDMIKSITSKIEKQDSRFEHLENATRGLKRGFIILSVITSITSLAIIFIFLLLW